jgi:hypothetical protein
MCNLHNHNFPSREQAPNSQGAGADPPRDGPRIGDGSVPVLGIRRRGTAPPAGTRSVPDFKFSKSGTGGCPAGHRDLHVPPASSDAAFDRDGATVRVCRQLFRNTQVEWNGCHRQVQYKGPRRPAHLNAAGWAGKRNASE